MGAGAIYLIGVAAFSPQLDVYKFPRPFFPNPFSIETKILLLGSGGVMASVRSSVVVAVNTLLLSMVNGAPAGYAIARFVFPGRDAFRLIVVSRRAFPIVIVVIPLAVSFIEWGLYDSVSSLALPFTILITSSLFASVPRDLEEAAMTLGCYPLKAFLRAALRLALPGLAAATLFAFVLSWNEVFAAVILTVRDRTLPARVLTVLDESPLLYRCAGGCFMLAPSLIFMLFLHQYLFTLWGEGDQVRAEIRLEHIHKTLGKTAAAHSVSLTIRDREFMALLGPSGCGKTTLLRSIAGLDQIDAGQIFIGGREVTALPPRQRRIARVFQSYAVFPRLTVYANIAFGLRMQRVADAEVKRRVGAAADLLQIVNLLDRYPAKVSGGQRQGVAVARAIAVQAEMLLMDDPLSNLDALLRLEMRAELKRLLQEVTSRVVDVTHDQVEALGLGDRIAVMKEGESLQCDRPLAVYDHPATEFVGGFIGNPPMSFLQGRIVGDIVFAGGGRFQPSSGVGAALADGQAVRLGIRAENIEPMPAAAEGTLAAQALVVEPLGSHNLPTIQIGDERLKVNTHADAPVQPGQPIWLSLSPDKIRWMDPASGRALVWKKRRNPQRDGAASPPAPLRVLPCIPQEYPC